LLADQNIRNCHHHDDVLLAGSHSDLKDASADRAHQAVWWSAGLRGHGVGRWEPNGEPIASVEADDPQSLFLIVMLLAATERLVLSTAEGRALEMQSPPRQQQPE
jgi:hypothetical protein